MSLGLFPISQRPAWSASIHAIHWWRVFGRLTDWRYLVAYAWRLQSATTRNWGGVGNHAHIIPYLYGHDVAIFTDHTPVKSILPTGRWWMKVCASRVNIRYCPGRVSMLSLCPQLSLSVDGVDQSDGQVAAMTMISRHPVTTCCGSPNFAPWPTGNRKRKQARKIALQSSI